MPLTTFLALSILSVDFLIYFLFHWTFGDKRKSLSRELAECKAASQESSPRLLNDASPSVASASQSRWSARATGTPQLTFASQTRS